VSGEDTVATFQLEQAPVRGRIVRLGAGTIDPILRRHAYPRPVALLLGEAVTLAALIGSLLKVEGVLSLQAEGDGPVPLLVAEWRSTGAVRAYARLAPDYGARLNLDHAVAPHMLIGEGVLALTLDQGPGFQPLQARVPLEGDTLSACAENYFLRSEQTPTRVRLAVVEELAPGQAPVWRGGGMLIQRIAADDARGETEEGWRTADALFSTLTDAELADHGLAQSRLLFQLFHEVGVRLAEPEALLDRCTCDEGRLRALMARFTAEEVADLVEPDGLIHAACQFCARKYAFPPTSLLTSVEGS
jgi:molecular chaperone Hsp33